MPPCAKCAGRISRFLSGGKLYHARKIRLPDTPKSTFRNVAEIGQQAALNSTKHQSLAAAIAPQWLSPAPWPPLVFRRDSGVRISDASSHQNTDAPYARTTGDHSPFVWRADAPVLARAAVCWCTPRNSKPCPAGSPDSHRKFSVLQHLLLAGPDIDVIHRVYSSHITMPGSPAMGMTLRASRPASHM